ncbi:hypothetical protein ASG54_08415 [Aureimonas sp. Leaf460]|nr:hypothetical protein ASG62_22350 [Aureimonas sp. Leaf427]KQT80146.1 hypothetical protein ASG54_08415 [Aureimonas sp. Leaf460]
MPSRPAYPSDVSDEEWALVAPYLTLLREDAGQREHTLREAFNGLRFGVVWRAMPHDVKRRWNGTPDRRAKGGLTHN